MNSNIFIILFIISSIISTPPPIPAPTYETFVIHSPIQRLNTDESPRFKRLSDSKQFVENNKVTITILDDGVSEEHELKVSTKNLPDGSSYRYYSEGVNLPEGETLTLDSQECHRFKNTGEEVAGEGECISNLITDGNSYKFTFNYTLKNDEYIKINYKYHTTRTTPDILYRQESIFISKYYSEGYCDYKFIIPEKYKNLGLRDNKLTKESDYIYIYKENCPNEQINDVIRLAPKEGYWKGEMGLYIESSTPNSGKVTLIFPRFYRGGKNKNKNYYLITNEEKSLKESYLIEDQTFLKVVLPGNNNKKVGVKLETAFSNNLEEEFVFYPSEDLLELDGNIDNEIKTKAEEIINDENSPYKDYPNYYKIGKFVHSHITYNFSFFGNNLTAVEIFNERRGVCEHYTILYNAMLNAIGIKTATIFGWALDKNNITANEKSVGHAWTLALIKDKNGNDKFMELDATWDLFEGVPAGHILKGFNKETLSYYSTGGSDLKATRTHLIQLVENLNSEEEDILINNMPILNEKDIVEESANGTKTEKVEESASETKTEKVEESVSESKGSDKEEDNPSESKGSDKEEDNPSESKGSEKDEEGKTNEVKSSGIIDKEDVPSESISSEPENSIQKKVNNTDNKASNLNISNLIYILILLNKLL